jgi:hypothetical protein
MKWAIFLLIAAFLSCKQKQEVCFIDATDVKKGLVKDQIVIKDTNHLIAAIYDDGWDSVKGGAYIFYPNEQLKSYTFYQSGKPVYTESYNQAGYLTGTTGSPMVCRVINDLGDDSATVQVYFFRLFKDYQALSIKINENPAVSYTLQTDTDYANIKSVSFGINTSNLTKLNMYSQVKYIDECSKTEHILSVSIFLIKNPNLEPAPAGVK